MNESFVFYRSFAEAIEDLPAEQFKAIMVALSHYALDGEELDNSDPIVKAMLTLMRPQIDANNRRRESGSKGGKQNKATPKQSEANSKQSEANSKQTEASTKQTEATPKQSEANVNANANVNVNANANVNNNARAREEGLETADLTVKVRKSLNEYFDTLEKLNQRPLIVAKRQNIVKKLLSISQDEKKQIELIDTARKNGWQNVYSENSKAEAKKERFGIQRSNDLDKLIAAQIAASTEGG